METKTVDGLTLWYEPQDADTAELVARACHRSLALLRSEWGLGIPGECRIYVMTSPQRFLLHAAPWPWRLYVRATMPLRRRRIQQLWTMAGGWAQRFGAGRAIGVRPPRLLDASP
ncbi:MAG: hypothetical protein JXA09_15090 [Anaerolineae bacterium]|nr:hypothetical protein [Anaerolineae bacterium]